jgi:acetyltransferase-like isoleucine patch superfamily enzyme
MAFYTKAQLRKIGLKSFGENVLISDKASIYSPEMISIGSNVRIDDFCILSGEIILGNFIHISAYNALYGKGCIQMDDYTGLSPRCTLFSTSDDFSGEFMISPIAPIEHTNVLTGKIIIKRFSQIGAGSIILPNVTIEEGTAVGAMSLVKNNTSPWGIYAGCPVKLIKERSKGIQRRYESIYK